MSCKAKARKLTVRRKLAVEVRVKLEAHRRPSRKMGLQAKTCKRKLASESSEVASRTARRREQRRKPEFAAGPGAEGSASGASRGTIKQAWPEDGPKGRKPDGLATGRNWKSNAGRKPGAVQPGTS